MNHKKINAQTTQTSLFLAFVNDSSSHPFAINLIHSKTIRNTASHQISISIAVNILQSNNLNHS
jgi:hypothetical protein